MANRAARSRLPTVAGLVATVRNVVVSYVHVVVNVNIRTAIPISIPIRVTVVRVSVKTVVENIQMMRMPAD